jgi:single-stranded-DNA-specific exonuclease
MAEAMEGLPRFEGLSAKGQRWRLPEAVALQHGAALAQATGLPAVVASILAQRGFITPEHAADFLQPHLRQLPDPDTLHDMPRAVARLVRAIEAREQVAILGDYDADGTCATALLAGYLQALGLAPQMYLPDRLTEGYGPNPAAMRTLAARGATLVVMVDTGSNALPSLTVAAELGLDVLVCDHHPPAAPLPPEVVLVNPHQPADTSTLGMLCGTGVVWFVLLAVNRALRQQGWFGAQRPEPDLRLGLDLVALATVADVMPLVGANRVLVHKGLQQLATWRRPGLAALAQVAGILGGSGDGKANTFSLGFQLGPRLNAAGRVASAQAALQLLMARDAEIAGPLADALQTLNTERQAVEKAILHAALALAEQQMADPNTLGLVLAEASWHPGVVGIVASRVRERFGRPTFVLGKDANGHWKGSGRSIVGLDVGQAVVACGAVCLSGGGHAQAAGVTLAEDKLADFRKGLNAALWAQLDTRADAAAGLPLAERLAPELRLAGVVGVGACTAELVQQLQQLAPFGAGHPEPVLLLQGARVAFVKPVGATQSHLQLSLKDASNSVTLAGIAFGAAETPLGPLLTQSAGRALTLAVTLKLDTFRNQTRVQVQVVDAWAH